jgi:ribonucleoside-diphosphate reductase alpha chain
MTRNPEVRFAKSIVDYVFRWMAAKFLSDDAKFHAGVNVDAPGAAGPAAGIAPAGDAPPAVSAGAKASVPSEFAAIKNQEDAPPCPTCGSIMVRSGACYKCANCGTTSGCA